MLGFVAISQNSTLGNSVAPDDVSGVCYAVIFVHHKASDRARARCRIGAFDEVFQPSRFHDGIVLELNQILTTSGAKAKVESA